MEDLTNKIFGRLKVIKFDHSTPRYYPNGSISGHRHYWLCKCICGNYKVVEHYALTKGTTKSCGCLKKEQAKTNFSKHNLTNHRLYNIYAHIKQRCYKKECKAYKDYGARGIKMCQEWENDFLNFYNWALNNGYKENLTIDRIDNNGNYEPKNCRWVTLKKQQNNKRNNFLITIYNRTQTLSEWCEEKELDYKKIQSRLSRGWLLEDAMTKK